jgi:putative transposase
MSTYTQLHVHVVFAVKFREALISADLKPRLNKYIIAILQNHGHKMLAINGIEDHIHLFFGWRPAQSLSDLMKIVKGESSEWINKHRLAKALFRWQEGFSAFSISKSHTDRVVKYIQNQEIHHQKVTMREEIRTLLTENGIDFDERYIFQEPI